MCESLSLTADSKKVLQNQSSADQIRELGGRLQKPVIILRQGQELQGGSIDFSQTESRLKEVEQMFEMIK